MAKFFFKKNTCLGCKQPMKESSTNQAVCDHCYPNESNILAKEIEKLNEFEMKYNKLWTQCQRCTGSLLQEVICTSFDCPIFYMRKKAKKDLDDVQKSIDRFDCDW